MLDQMRQDLDQEALALPARGMGMKAARPSTISWFLNLGPKSSLRARRVPHCLAARRRGNRRLCSRHRLPPSRRREDGRAAKLAYLHPVPDRHRLPRGGVNNLPYVLTVEKLAGIEVPDRVKVIRVMMAEFFPHSPRTCCSTARSARTSARCRRCSSCSSIARRRTT